MTHHILDLLRKAVVEYGYWAVGTALLLENAGIPVPGETVLLLASFLAYSQRELQLSWLIAIGTVAATLGDNAGYALGQYGGRPLLERYQSLFRIPQQNLARGEALFARYGDVTVFFARFVFGLRIFAGPMAGVLRMPWRRFAFFNLAGAAVWVTFISLAGYLFGRHWARLERIVGRVDVAIVVVIAAIVLVWWRRSQRMP